MYTMDEDARETLVQLVNRPAYLSEPTVLLFAREEDGEAVRAWWRDTVGDGPRVQFRNVRTPLPEPVLTPDNTYRVPGRTQIEPADLVLVDGRHADVARFWREYGDGPVVELEVEA